MAQRSPPRTTRNSLEGLPGLTPRVIGKSVRSPSQMCKDRHARQILSSWPITRSNKSSRGIQRLPGHNECFRLAAIQSLLHLPKFMNWILSHNEDGKFPCHPDIEAIQSEHAIYHGVCPACGFKSLIKSYWSDDACFEDGTPSHFAGNDVDVQVIHQLDNYIFGLDGAQYQQDSEECQSRLIQACLNSVDHSDIGNRAWLNQHNALFVLDPIVSRQCSHCHFRPTVPPGQDDPRIGFPSVPIQQSGEDSLREALVRATDYALPELECSNCGENGIYEKLRIDGAPEILRIKLNINLDWDRKLQCMPKNFTPVTFPRRVSLTKFQQNQARSLRYKLSSVLPHNGSTMSTGHWVATVRGPEHVFAINDSHCVQMEDPFMNSNPQQLAGSGKFEAVVLTYVRVHFPRPRRLLTELY